MPSPVKDLMLNEIRSELKKNPDFFISNFEGLTVADFSDLRRILEKVSRRSFVVKHAMVKRVFAEMNVSAAEKFLKGSVLITLGSGELAVISKALVEFAKTNQKFAPAGVVIDSQTYDQEYVKQLAKLPSRKELLTQVVVRVKSPISGFVLTLNQLLRGFVVALNEVKKKKELQVA